MTVLVLAFAHSGVAQSLNDNQSVQAREQNRAGIQAAREGRWAEARAAFERSYALAPQPLTLFNLAGAQAENGLLVEAIVSYRRFLDAAVTQSETAYADEARAALARLERRVAHARFVIEGLATGDAVTLDGASLVPQSVQAAFPVDPGAHVARVVRSGREVARADFASREGETSVVTLHATIAVLPSAMVTRPRVTDRRVQSSSVGYWIAGGATVAVLAAVGVALGLAVSASQPTTPADSFRGNFPPGTVVFP